MNRTPPFRVRSLFVALVLAAPGAPALAQAVKPIRTELPPGVDPAALQKKLEAARPVLELRDSVLLLAELIGRRKIDLDRAQARRLLAIAHELRQRPSLTPREAGGLRDTIENGVLTEQQVAVLDAATLDRRPPGGAASGNTVVRIGGPGSPDDAPDVALMNRIAAGQNVNPFAEGSAARLLDAWIALLTGLARP